MVGNWNGIWKSQSSSQSASFILVSLSGMSPNVISFVATTCEMFVTMSYLHVFFECTATRDSWQAAGLEVVLRNDEYESEYVAAQIFAICNEDSGIVGHVATLF
ncbi:hypothetical protein L195_g006323 [Trifolium pratense]|uniref:Uncharacterized protein n=1 Tax=Trifolium pratense TaxID=57577 RepID=A0A2K3P394_TRIPR|nr:hypothetical protein L195_g006323 [Trifolium pratense]